jgi:hypothetical protein
MSDILFGRRIKVTIYKQGLTQEELQEALSESPDDTGLPNDGTPQQNSSAPESGSGILSFEIDESLPLEFEVTKTLDNSGKSNTATLRVYGISEATARAMGYQMLTCKISVGYRGQQLIPIFLGDILSASYKRGKKSEAGYADFQMSQSYLKLNAGYKLSMNFPRDTDLLKILSEVMDTFGIEFKFLSADSITEELLQQKITYGLALDGTLNECLQKVLKPYGFKWHINEANQVEVFQDDVYSSTDGKVGTIAGGKLKVEEVKADETRTGTGLTIYELGYDSGLIERPYLETESITNRLSETKPQDNSKPEKTKAKPAKKKSLVKKVTFARQVVNFTTLLLPEIQPKTVVKIDAGVGNESVSGLYGIISVKYKGQTFGNDWYCQCVGVSTEKEA